MQSGGNGLERGVCLPRGIVLIAIQPMGRRVGWREVILFGCSAFPIGCGLCLREGRPALPLLSPFGLDAIIFETLAWERWLPSKAITRIRIASPSSIEGTRST